MKLLIRSLVLPLAIGMTANLITRDVSASVLLWCSAAAFAVVLASNIAWGEVWEVIRPRPMTREERRRLRRRARTSSAKRIATMALLLLTCAIALGCLAVIGARIGEIQTFRSRCTAVGGRIVDRQHLRLGGNLPGDTLVACLSTTNAYVKGKVTLFGGPSWTTTTAGKDRSRVPLLWATAPSSTSVPIALH
jgi:hypothetical protein